MLAGCGGTGEPPPPREDALATLADIPVGEAVAATAPDGSKLLVAQPAEGAAVGFSSVCTHQGCTPFRPRANAPATAPSSTC